MRGASPKVSQAVKDGQAAGATLADLAAHVLLRQYSSRTITKQSQATERWSNAWESLRSALGAMTSDPAVVAALREVDEAWGDSIVEHEDAAWHAAWTLAMNLGAGVRAAHAPSKASR